MFKRISSGLCFLALCIACWAQPAYVRNPLDTNSMALPTIDGQYAALSNGLPVFRGLNQTVTRTWLGPTNLWNISTNDYNYGTLTPFQVTGFSFISTLTENSSLTISNSATTNVLGILPASVHWGSLTNRPTLTNGMQIDIEVKRSTAGYTNGIYQFF